MPYGREPFFGLIDAVAKAFVHDEFCHDVVVSKAL